MPNYLIVLNKDEDTVSFVDESSHKVVKTDIPTPKLSNYHHSLLADGMEIDPPEHEAWGTYTFNFKIPGGDFTVEVACTAGEG